MIVKTPAGAMRRPKIMLINQGGGSGWDFLSYSSSELGLGPSIGTPIWGELIGFAANPGLTDGGYMAVPVFRFFDADSRWNAVNRGAAPDIGVAQDPITTNERFDTQLERH